MKRIFAIFLCLVFIFLLGSCSPAEETESENNIVWIPDESEPSSTTQGGASAASGGRWIRYEDVSIDISLDPLDTELCSEAQDYYYVLEQTMLRFNKITGEASSVCSDPLCNHSDSNCDFFTIGARAIYSIANNTIYYLRKLYNDKEFSYQEIWKYDIENQTAIKLCRGTGSSYSSIVAIATGCYITEYSTDTSANIKDREYVTDLYFIDKKGTITKLLSASGNLRVESVEDGKLWWYDNSGGFYVSDPYGKEFSAYNTTTRRPKRENYAFYMRSSGISNGKPLSALYRTDLDTGEEVQLLDNCAQYTILGDRIYYLEYLKESIVLGPVANGSGNHTDAFGGKLYSMDFNGEDKKLVVDDESIHFMKLPTVRNSPHMDDRYMGILLTHYEEATTGKRGLISYAWRSMLVYDTETGEYRIGVYEP